MSGLVLDGVWKAYPAWDAGTRTLRGALARRAPLFMRGPRRWALQDVSLEVAAGESVAVIGHNGAGKSTLLRVASGLARPTRGKVTTPPRTAAVLGLGSWFDPSLTGRENAVTAAVILGFTRSQAAALVPRIFEFAEIPDFADAPVRVYSEGMKLRLAFGVLAQLEPELLLVDEVLAVGDVGFQQKCVARIREMRDAGTALLLASHDLGQVVAECERAVWLSRGEVRQTGPAGAVVDSYREAGRAETLRRTPATDGAPDERGLALRVNRFGSQELAIEHVVLDTGGDPAAAAIGVGSSLAVSMELRPSRPGIADPVVSLVIVRLSDGAVCAECSSAGGLRLADVERAVEVRLVIDRLDLVPGEYAIDLGAYPPDWAYAYDFHWHAHRFRVVGEPGGSGVLRPPFHWTASPSSR